MTKFNDQPPRESGGVHTVRFRISDDQKETLEELQEKFEMNRKELLEIIFHEFAEWTRVKS